MICAQVRDSGGDAYNRWPATLLAKVEFGKRWTFGDDYTRQHFGLYKRRFIRHHRRDRHYDFSQDFELPEFRERLLVGMCVEIKFRAPHAIDATLTALTG